MSTTTDRAAQIIDEAAKALSVNWRNMHSNESLGHQRMLAQALADAGLLATPEHDAEQRRTGAVEALREAAMLGDEDHITEIALGGFAYVQDWLTARADRIEAQR